MAAKPQKNNTINLLYVLVIFMAVALVIISGIALQKTVKYSALTSGMYNENVKCANYCEELGRPYFLHDFLVGACQCYDANEEPAEFINLYKEDLVK